MKYKVKIVIPTIFSVRQKNSWKATFTNGLPEPKYQFFHIKLIVEIKQNTFLINYAENLS